MFARSAGHGRHAANFSLADLIRHYLYTRKSLRKLVSDLFLRIVWLRSRNTLSQYRVDSVRVVSSLALERYNRYRLLFQMAAAPAHPEKLQFLVPYLTVDGALDAIEYYKKAF